MAEAWEESLPRLLLEMGYYALKRGSLSDAHVLLKGAQALRPGDPTPAMFRGMAHFAAGEYSEAERSYRQILERHADDDLTRTFLAESLIAQKRWSDAQALLAAVIRDDRHKPAVSFARELLNGLARGILQRAAT
jgi:Flp pilus assembly protein TadD